MTPEQRSESARKAVKARWAKKKRLANNQVCKQGLLFVHLFDSGLHVPSHTRLYASTTAQYVD